MEYGDGGADVMKKISIGLSFADEKIKLIDILSEDDYFLVQAPSVSEEFEGMEQKEQESRPSFLRRSLAWDSAFSNSAGVLDPDELSIINNGFINNESSPLPADHEVRNRRSVSESYLSDVDFSANWFEIEPLFFKSKNSLEMMNVEEKTPKPELKHNVQSSRKADKSSLNKIKSDPSLIGKSKEAQSEGKMKKESSITRSDNKNLTEKSNLNNKSVRTGSASASSLYKRRTGLKKTQHSPTVQASMNSRKAEMKKGIGNIASSTHSASLLNQPSCSPPANSTLLFPSRSPVHKLPRSIDANDVKEASHLQSRQSGSLSAKGIRPSGLRLPSPNLRYFDESTCTRNHGAVRSRKMPQKVMHEESGSSRIAEARRMVKTPNSETDKQDAASAQGKKELEILCRNLEAVALSCDVENGGLPALKQGKRVLNSSLATSRRYRIIPACARTAMSTRSSRTPLAEKRSDCNSGKASALRMEPKMMQTASSLRYDFTKN